MAEQGYITQSEYLDARTEGLGLNPGDKYRVIHDPFLFDLVQHELIEKYGLNTVRNGGLKAYTTINPDLQEKAEAAVEESCYVCYPEGGPAAGLASVDPKTGAILALASTQGSASESQFNYAWQAQKQPGSSFKTYVLTTAIKQGIDPASTYYDGTSPKVLANPGGGFWKVENAESGGGVMSIEEATWASVNVIFAQLDLDVGPEAVTETAHQMGIESPLHSLPAEAIGGLAVGVSPLEMADGYATLADGGVHHDPTAISKVVFPDGKVDEISQDAGERVLTPGQAWEVTRILEGVITHGTGTGYTSIGCTSHGGQDRHLRERVRRLVRRLHAAVLDRGLGRPSRLARTDRVRRSRPRARSGRTTCRPRRAKTARNSKSPRACRRSRRFTSVHTRSASEVGEEEEEKEGKKKKHKGKGQGEEEEEGEEEEGEEETPEPEPKPEPQGPPPAVGGGVSPP